MNQLIASYMVGINFQMWQNMKTQTIAREILVNLFSVLFKELCLTRFGELGIAVVHSWETT